MTASKASKRKRRFLWWLVVLAPLLGLFLMLFLAANSDLPSTEDLEDPRSDLATAILFSNGVQMGQYYRENRIPVKYAQISPNVVKALIATEDERFREHSGVDVRGSVRAAVYLGKRGGASTLTQQLSKMLFTDRADNIFKRIFQKFQEWIISARLERQYTKDEIIAMYLNRFDWINQAVGINSAARVYFDTTPDSLNVEEAALLVGMCKNPSLYNPLRKEENATKRRMVVLDQMRKNGYLTTVEYDSLKLLPLGLRFQRIDHAEGLAPYFREILRAKLQTLLASTDAEGNLRYAKSDGSAYDIYTDGLKVYTTLDHRMQEYGEFAVKEHLSTELQADFFKDIARKKNRPFDYRVSQNEIEGILNTAMKRSMRYKIMTGKQCGNCERPAKYIEKVKFEGAMHFHCKPELGGCDTYWAVVEERRSPKCSTHPWRCACSAGRRDRYGDEPDGFHQVLQELLAKRPAEHGPPYRLRQVLGRRHRLQALPIRSRGAIAPPSRIHLQALRIRHRDPRRDGAVPRIAQPESVLRHAARSTRLVPREQRCEVRWHGHRGICLGQLHEHHHRLADEAIRPTSRYGAGAPHGSEEPAGSGAFTLLGRRRPYPDGDDRGLLHLREPRGLHRTHHSSRVSKTRTATPFTT
jgi:hypothetical protein